MVIVDEWHGTYPSRWKGLIVPDAIAHPAKFSSRLIRRIYEHMIAEGWLAEGQTIVDPFGGIALGALDAMRLGLRWRGVELEVKFSDLGNQNIGLWNKRYSTMPHWCSDAVLLNGDSRNLVQVLDVAEGCVSSPPYAGIEVEKNSKSIDRSKQYEVYKKSGGGQSFEAFCHTQDIHSQGYGSAPGNLGNMKSTAAGLQAAVSSPPYGVDVEPHGDLSLSNKEMIGRHYSATVASPPYSEALGHGGQSEIDDAKRLFTRREFYGQTPGQLGAMKANGFEAAVSSPPFKGQSADGGWQMLGKYAEEGKLTVEQVNGDPSKSYPSWNKERDTSYGHAEGQLADMAEGSFDAAVSSPPFECQSGGTNVTAKRGPLADKRLLERHAAGNAAAGYGDAPGNMGSEQGDDFWSAARQIVEQVYQVLAPGGHAVWVVKALVKNKQIVDFPGQWRQLCEAAGFETLHEHHAMLVRHKGTSLTLEGKRVEHITESKSFFRRLAEKKGSPRIDYEVVLCMVKGWMNEIQETWNCPQETGPAKLGV
jgi:hypothetical protein